MLLLWALACAPSVYRMPGPLAGLGHEPSSEWALQKPPREAPARPSKAAPPTPVAIAEAAAGFVGDPALVVDGERYRFDCSGLVEASLASAGCAFSGSSAMLFDQARQTRVLHRRRMPSPGDVAFFDDTYDRNGNGKLDDPLSHVAVVESVEKDGTITLVHVGSRGVVRFVMNLRHPDDQERDGKLVNDYLRARRSGDSPRTRYLASELWVAFGSFWDAPAVSARSGDEVGAGGAPTAHAPVQVATAERSTR